MSERIVTLNEEVIKGQIKELVRGSVEETLNELLEAEAEKLTQAARYERSEARQGYRSGHYDRNLTTTSGDVTLSHGIRWIRQRNSTQQSDGTPPSLWRPTSIPFPAGTVDKAPQ